MAGRVFVRALNMFYSERIWDRNPDTDLLYHTKPSAMISSEIRLEAS